MIKSAAIEDPSPPPTAPSNAPIPTPAKPPPIPPIAPPIAPLIAPSASFFQGHLNFLAVLISFHFELELVSYNSPYWALYFATPA